ncbi:MAG TPA: ComF family protein [Rhodocyclaceae bacterium]|nr:ComF family protein [Rhodocyclaceae bacterium]
MITLPVLPQSCLLCATDSPAAVCPACADELPRLHGGCPQCAEATSHGARCGRCLQSPPAFDRTLALFAYEFPVDQMVQMLKYGQRLILAHWFGNALARHCADLRADTIAPMPLHPDKLRQRGFNQALEIARPLAKALTRPLQATLCQRTRATHTQADLPLKERPANVRNAFFCGARLDGQHIVLVDDVMTTGASLHECAKALKQAGAAQVSAVVVGRTLRHG